MEEAHPPRAAGLFGVEQQQQPGLLVPLGLPLKDYPDSPALPPHLSVYTIAVCISCPWKHVAEQVGQTYWILLPFARMKLPAVDSSCVSVSTVPNNSVPITVLTRVQEGSTARSFILTSARKATNSSWSSRQQRFGALYTAGVACKLSGCVKSQCSC